MHFCFIFLSLCLVRLYMCLAVVLVFINPCVVKAGVRIHPQATMLAAISEPLGINGCALATFPEYELATRWHLQIIFDTFHKSNMAAVKPEIL